MGIYRALVLVLLWLPALLSPGLAWAQGADGGEVGGQTEDPTTKEARERFDQGLKLYNEGDAAGALAEFERVYELVPNVTVLYNIGRVYVKLNRPVDAVRAFDEVLESAKELSPEDKNEARRIREEQLRKIGSMIIETKSEDAVVEVDGKRVGQTPLPGPVRVAGGMHRVRVIAPGYYPFSEEVMVAGGAERTLQVELIATGSGRASLEIESPLPDAIVVVDGEEHGRTPLHSPIVLKPGKHEVILKRKGYIDVTETISLEEGAAGKIALTPDLDRNALAARSGTLVVVADAAAIATIDGITHPAGALRFQLPPGKHDVRVELAGHVPNERTVTVPRDAVTTLEFELVATSATVSRHRRRVRRRRLIGAGLAVAGVGALTGGALYLSSNAQAIDDAQEDYDLIVWETEENTGRRCDVYSTDFNREQCATDLDTYYDALQDEQAKTKWGYVMIGSGGALVVTGAVLFAAAGRPGKYREARRVRLVSGPGDVGMALVGRF